jgi:hypothetical protein
MPQIGFEPTIPVFERAKTVHASDRAATVIGRYQTTSVENRKRDSINTFVKFLNAFHRRKLLTQICANGDEYIRD